VTSEVSIARKAITAAVFAVALFAAVAVQVTVVNRIPFPGSAAPDLVLLLVTAIAVVTTPAVGAFTGFAGGLALDIAPPAAHYAGEYALVFCLVGYAAARVVRAIWDTSGERDPLISFTVMAVAAALGEAGKAALGMLLSDPDVTTAVVSRVLPAAILYDLLLAPLVFWLVALVMRGAVSWHAGAEHAPAPVFSHDQRLASVFRQASAGAVPNLHLAGTGESYTSPSVPRRVPKLRLSGTTGGSSHRTTAGSAGSSPFPLAAGRTARLSFGGDLPVHPGARAPQGRQPGKNWLRGAASPSAPVAKRAARGPAPGWLRSSGSGAQAGARATGSAGGPPRGFMSAARSGGGAGSSLGGRSTRSASDALAARSAPSGLSALSGAGTPLAGRSPRAGWLRTSRTATAGPAFSARRLSPRSGWLGAARRPRTVIGSGVGKGGRPLRRRGSARGNWYAASPSGAWLRRSRHPWRKRRQRLLRMVGVGK
jgi:rod shape-determining protein MreD